MPHNLYLHSSIVQTRKFEQTPAGKREAIKFATIDSTLALDVRALYQRRHSDRVRRRLTLVGSAGGCGNPGRLQASRVLFSESVCASALFAIALLASGQNSTLTGTLAGQIVMEGFLELPDHTVAASVDHARDCHYSRRS